MECAEAKGEGMSVSQQEYGKGPRLANGAQPNRNPSYRPPPESIAGVAMVHQVAQVGSTVVGMTVGGAQ